MATALSYTYKKLRFCSSGSINIKKVLECVFIINGAEYTGSDRSLYCEGDSLFKKTTCSGFFGTRAPVPSKLIQKRFSARAGGTLNLKNICLKNISIINYISIFVRFSIFCLGRGRSGLTNQECSYSTRG